MIPRIFASIVDKLVTKAGYGQDVLRVCRIWFELLPQVRDVADVTLLWAQKGALPGPPLAESAMPLTHRRWYSVEPARS